MLRATRDFFESRGLVEVDCPILSGAASVDAHIDLVEASCCGKKAFLHSSPEYGMKRLLAEGCPDIYQLSHVFRDEECGPRHNPEFTLVEWYRKGISFQEMIHETLDFLSIFRPKGEVFQASYRDHFLQHTGLDPFEAPNDELRELLHDCECSPELLQSPRDTLLHLSFALLVEANFDPGKMTVVKDFPASQAALAQIRQVEGHPVGERFEVYWGGHELANGYHELSSAKEQRERFNKENQMRLDEGKCALPPDEEFLAALEKGLPDCCGVAVGFDRLLMLHLGLNEISQVLPLATIELG